MAIAETQGNELKNAGYEIFIGILSILSIVNIVLLYAVDDANLDSVLYVMNVLFSAIFLADFTYRLLTADSKSRYFFRQFGWADLLASLPFEQLKILRIFRLIRVFRLLREYGAQNIGRSLIKDRAGSALYVLLLMGILVLEFGSLEILNIEQYAPGANITTGSGRDLVRHRDHLDGRVRRSVSGDESRSSLRFADHRDRRRHLRHVHRLPRQLLPLASEESRPSRTAASPAQDPRTRRSSRLRELMAQQQAAMDEIDRLLADEASARGSDEGPPGRAADASQPKPARH